jgi:hypothetical protein
MSKAQDHSTTSGYTTCLEKDVNFFWAGIRLREDEKETSRASVIREAEAAGQDISSRHHCLEEASATPQAGIHSK